MKSIYTSLSRYNEICPNDLDCGRDRTNQHLRKFALTICLTLQFMNQQKSQRKEINISHVSLFYKLSILGNTVRFFFKKPR